MTKQTTQRRSYANADQGYLIALQATEVEEMKGIWDTDETARYRQTVQSMIASCIRGDDLVIQLSGGIFAVFLPGTNVHQAEMVADRVVAASVISVCEFDDGTTHEVPVTIRGIRKAPREAFDKLCTSARSRRHAREWRHRPAADLVTPGLTGTMMKGSLGDEAGEAIH